MRDGAVDVVGQALDDQRYLMRRETFVADCRVLHGITVQTSALANRPFQRFTGHRSLLGLLDGQAQARVHVGIGARFGSDLDFLGQLAHDLAFGIGRCFSMFGFPLCAHVDSLVSAAGSGSDRPKVGAFYTPSGMGSTRNLISLYRLCPPPPQTAPAAHPASAAAAHGPRPAPCGGWHYAPSASPGSGSARAGTAPAAP
ncbi:hypothetical protein D3C79_864750 [compost metagenome]